MFNTQRLISDRMLAIDASGIRKVFDLAAKIKDPINLSIGQPDFDVPAPVRQAAVDAIQAGHNKYTQTQGIAELRNAVVKKFQHEFAHDGRWAAPSSLIISGVSGGLLLAIMTCVGPGDEVLIADPYFVMYKHLVTLAGGKAKFIDTYPDFQLTPGRVAPHITEKTKVLILGSPANPTGVVTPPAVMEQLVELCEQHNVLLISDEIYDEFCYAKVAGRAPSPASFGENLLVLRGFSKTYAMTGWRLGYAIGPAALIEQMTKLQQYTFVCAPSMVQDAGLAALDVDMSDYVAAYQRKRDMVVAMLKDRFELTVPQGAFYAFPKVPTGESASKFVERAIAKKLLIIPGNVFSERDTHFRISYACEDKMLERGLEILNELAK